MSDFIFYLCVQFAAVLILYVADMMVSDKKRILIENSKTILLQGEKSIMGRHVCFLLAFLILFVISALRDHVGYDYNAYASLYLSITAKANYDDAYWNVSSNNLGNLGWGYVLICKIIGIFAPENYYIMFAVMAFLTLWLLMKAIYRMSCSWSMSLYLFVCFCFYYQSFNGFRQMLAVTIVLYACYFLLQDKVKIYLTYVFFAWAIHPSAYIMVVLCFLYKRKINLKNLLSYLIVCILFHILYSTLVVRLMSISSYGGYLASNYNESNTFSSILKAVSGIAIIFGCLLFYRKTIKRAPYTVLFYNVAIISTIISTLAIRAYIINRVIWYFHMMYIILIPEVLKTIDECFNKVSARLIRIFVIIMFFVYHSYYYYSAWTKAGYRMLFL